MINNIIYLHGFLSSPMSKKAQETRAYIAQRYPQVRLHIPTLVGYPQQAAQQIEDVIATVGSEQLRFIGSSMGGYLASYFVEKYGGRAAIINPAVAPYDLLKGYLGDRVNPYTQEKFTLAHDHIAELHQLNTPVITHPENYQVWLQTGDETLDYSLAEQKYKGSHLVIEQGGNHSFVDFEQHLNKIVSFLLQT